MSGASPPTTPPPLPTLSVGDATVTLANVNADLTGNGSDQNYGTIGADILWAKGGYSIDFGKCELLLGGR